MGIFRPHYVAASEVVELVSAKSGDHARRNSESAQHDRHRRGKIFAVSFFAFEEEICDRIFRHLLRQLQRVSESSSEVVLDRCRFVVIIVSGTCNLGCQPRHSRIDSVEVQEKCCDLRRILLSRRAQLCGDGVAISDVASYWLIAWRESKS